MFSGKSPEEMELAGEESGGAFWDDLKSLIRRSAPVARRVVASPAGKAASAVFLGPKWAAAAGLTAAAAAVSKKKQQKAPAQNKPSVAAVAPVRPGTPPAPAPKIAIKSAGVAGYWSVMGAEAPMTTNEVMDLIRREPNPLKRDRMTMNLQRAVARRGR